MSTGTDLHIEVWPTSQRNLYFPILDGIASTDAAASVLSQLAPGSAVAIGDVGVRDSLMRSGAQQVRHVLTMKRAVADPWVAPDVPGLRLREWRNDDAELLAPVLVSAYDAEHPDPEDPDPAVAVRTLAGLAEDAANPRMRATTVAERGGRPVGAAFVLKCEHVTGWKGPWVMNVFREPDPAVPGVGLAMLVRALEVLSEDGETTLGLAVTASNPARKVYERLGFAYDFEGWILLLPAGDGPTH